MGTWDLGTEVPQQGPRAELRWESGASPQKPDVQSAVGKRIFVMCSYKIYGVPSGSCGVCYTSPILLLQKTLRIYANLTTHPGRGRLVTCLPVPHRGYASAVHFGPYTT